MVADQVRGVRGQEAGRVELGEPGLREGCADRLVAHEVSVREGRRLADVMQERRQAEERRLVAGRLRHGVDGSAGVVPKVLARDLVLGQAPLAVEFRGDHGEQARIGHQAQTDGRPRSRKQLDQLAADPLSR